ncbi:lysostaphin resistance A-like protein [Photobacterium sp. 1_MG-2023]|uniref:lysostaphin resistance A-like protein n=1 Tax=Photobacterium sp. 1_MG-2023 TaxID=3062646 RepID=UPI0034C64703
MDYAVRDDFAAVHLNIFQIPVAYILGTFMGWVFVKSRSLWPCLLMHAGYNALALWMWQLYEYDPSSVADGISLGQTQLMLLSVGIMLTISGFYLLKKLLIKPAACRL